MNNVNTHNPQNFGPVEIAATEGFRLLTLQEAQTLTDGVLAQSALGVEVFNKLSPEVYNITAGAWQKVLRIGANPLSKNFTYRTQAGPLPDTLRSESELRNACADFVDSWNYLSTYHHELMKGKGFWDGENSIIACLQEHAPGLIPIAIAAFDGQKIALVTSESSEKLEALRHGNPPDDKVPEFSGAEAEGADELLRIMDHSHARKWGVAEALVAKMMMNATRASMHGNKKF